VLLHIFPRNCSDKVSVNVTKVTLANSESILRWWALLD